MKTDTWRSDIMANTENCPKVGIVMGSDSDMPVMAKAADIWKNWASLMR